MLGLSTILKYKDKKALWTNVYISLLLYLYGTKTQNLKSAIQHKDLLHYVATTATLKVELGTYYYYLSVFVFWT